MSALRRGIIPLVRGYAFPFMAALAPLVLFDVKSPSTYKLDSFPNFGPDMTFGDERKNEHTHSDHGDASLVSAEEG